MYERLAFWSRHHDRETQKAAYGALEAFMKQVLITEENNHEMFHINGSS